MAALSGGERMSWLPLSCEGCPLSTNPGCGKFTAVEGKGGLGVLLVGEASGKTEAEEGLPFRPQAQAGGVLQKAIARAGWLPDQFWITNVIRCRPPRDWLEGAPWERAAIEHCSPNLERVIETLRPKAIVALGTVATRELTGMIGPAKEKRSISYLRGYPIATRYGPVVPSFHPAYLARGKMQYLGLLMRDIAIAIEVAQGRREVVFDPARVVEYGPHNMKGALELLARAEADLSLIIAYDLETTYSPGADEDALVAFSRDQVGEAGSFEEEEWEDDLEEEEGEDDRWRDRSALDVEKAEIGSIQFSLAPGQGITLPWKGEYVEVARRLLALPNPKAGHNIWLFDDPILARHGVEVAGIRHDTMWMWLHLQPDLSAHLQAVAGIYGMPFVWKHLHGSQANFYGAADVDAVQRIIRVLPGELERDGLWRAYDQLKRGFRQLLARMEKRGIPVDRDRLTELRDWLVGELGRLDREIQVLVPSELKPFSPKEGYVDKPNDLKEVLRRLPEIAGLAKTKRPAAVKAMPLDDERVRQAAEALGYEIRQVERDGMRIVKPLPFKANSSQQMINYIRSKGYRVPIAFKTGKETSAAKELLRLYEKHRDPVFSTAIESRQTRKLMDAYTGKPGPDGAVIGGWVPGPDGRLRATFLFRSTGQLAARDPNVLTTPKRNKELAFKFRKCIVAPPGHKIVTFDMASFHALTTGLEARDASYMRLARLDVHSYVAGWMVGFPGIETALALSDSDLKLFLKEIRKRYGQVRDNQAKPAVHGTNFGQGYKRLYHEYREHFVSEMAAKRLLDLLREIFPLLFQWQDAVVEEADRLGKLVSRYGFQRWFHDAKKWELSKRTGKWEHVPSKDAEKAKAFLPANDAHCYLQTKLMEMDELGWLDRYGLANVIHDEVFFVTEDRLVEECLWNVKGKLEEMDLVLMDPIVAPDGFWCAADGKVGQNWADWNDDPAKGPLNLEGMREVR